MANFKVCFLYLSVLFSSGAPGENTGNFPLSDCHTGQFDILVIQNADIVDYSTLDSLRKYIADAWIPDNTEPSRVLLSRIIDTSSYAENFTSLLTRFDGVETDLRKSFPIHNVTNSNLEVNIKQKITLARTVFSDMALGRRDSTHVAVLTYDSRFFSDTNTDKIRRIPFILQEHGSDIKLFIIMLTYGVFTVEEPLFLRDTIIAGKDITSQHVSMAVCKQCLPGWFHLELKESDLLSCYKLHVVPTSINWLQASETCAEVGRHLATVESKDELDFLQAHLVTHLHANRHLVFDSRDSAQGSVAVYIGLKRNVSSVAQRFQWTTREPDLYHPLVLNHWLPDSPNEGFNHACGVWMYRGIFNSTLEHDLELGNVSVGNLLLTDNISNILEGWATVGCATKVSSVSLCEVTLSRSYMNRDVVQVEPASKGSYSRAVTRGDFQEFEGKIVSTSAYANDKKFLDYMKFTNKDFPMFDCGNGTEKTNYNRYIPYSFVSDFIDHCSNRRDEGVHVLRFCSNCQCIPNEAMCDNVKDCKGGSDEEDCETCSGRRCCDGTCLPSHMFNDGEVDCNTCLTTANVTINDETSSNIVDNRRNESCTFICNRNQCIYPSQLNDGNIDCTGPEGPLDETIGKLERATSSVDVFGRSIWCPMCVYLVDRYGSIIGCRDLSHLQNCSDFQCPEGYYKCPGRYCIPLHYVKDGKSDCPVGEDEGEILINICVGNFACWKSSVCLHPDLVCDGAADCPHKDDELNCGVSCIDGLRCTAGTAAVDSNNPLVQLDNIKFLHFQTRYLDLSGVDLSNTEFELENVVMLFDIKLSKCNIVDLYRKFPFGFCCMKMVYSLDLSFNLIETIDGDNFNHDMWLNLRQLNLSYTEHLNEFINAKFENLENLDLSNTGLSYFDKRSFSGLPRLKNLSLSNTKLSTFHRHIFPSSFTLQTLDLRGSPIVHFTPNTYNGLIITSSLYTDSFRMCCPQVRGAGISEYTCHAPEDPISSCFNLIGSEIQQILLWLMAVIAILGNLIVIMYRFIWDRLVLEKIYGILVLNLGISDVIMGLYLFTIAVADIYYRGAYVLNDLDWKESIPCKIAGFLIALSSETATFFLFLITLERFVILTFPDKRKEFSRITKIGVVSLSWGVGVILALISVLLIFGNDQLYTSNAMCSLLPVANQQNGFEYSLLAFIVVNITIHLVTALGQMGILRLISRNKMTATSVDETSLSRVHDINVCKQLSLLVLSNLCCWLFVELMSILSLSGHVISNVVNAWTTVLVLPVHAAINPIIYIIPILIAKWNSFKYGSYRR